MSLPAWWQKEDTRAQCCLAFAMLMLSALPWSRFLATSSMFLLGFWTIVSWSDTGKWPTPRLGFWSALRLSWREKPWWLFLCFFLPVLVSGLWSQDMAYFAEKMRIRLPYFVLPIVFMTMPAWSKRQFHLLRYVLFVACIVSAAMVLSRYFMHFHSVNELIGKGQSIKTPISHIRYSLVLCMGFFFGFLLYLDRFYFRWPRFERRFQQFGLAFLFISVHILAVRSGWLALYSGIFVWVLHRGLVYKQWWLLLVFLGLCLVLPYSLYKTVPSIRQKIDYTIWDYKMNQNGQGATYSDSERWQSMNVGWQVAQSHFWFGAGAGNLDRKFKEAHVRLYPQNSNMLQPHNMYVYAWAGTGFVGLLIMLLGLVWPVWYYGRKATWFLWAHTLIIMLSFFFEATIENSSGVNLHAFLLSLLIHELPKRT